MSSPRLSLRSVTHHFDQETVLQGVDLDVEPGTITALMGESGSGKTTLGRITAGFISPASGSVSLDGELVAGHGTFVAPERRGVGVVPQEGALFSHLSVFGNVAFGLPRIGQTARLHRVQRVKECLEMVGLGDFSDRRTYELSGGQQQRVAVARALAPSPRLVVLDEPFSALDSSLRREVSQQVATALAQAGATALLITHDAAEAFRMADRIAILVDGKILQEGTPSEIYDKPHSLEVAQAGGVVMSLEAKREGEVLVTALGTLAINEVGYDSGCSSGILIVRPRQLRLSRTPEAGFTLNFVRVDGDCLHAHVVTPTGEHVEIQTLRPSEVEDSLAVGSSVKIEIMAGCSFVSSDQLNN